MVADFNIFGELRSEKLPFVELQELLLNAENLSRGKRFGGNSVQERFSYRRLFFPEKMLHKVHFICGGISDFHHILQQFFFFK